MQAHPSLQHPLYFFLLPQKVKLKLETLPIHESDGAAHIELNRPDKGNAMNGAMWKDLRSAFDWLSGSGARVGVLSGRGKHFAAGMDLELSAAVKSKITSLPEVMRQERLKEAIGELTKDSVVTESLTAASDGEKYRVNRLDHAARRAAVFRSTSRNGWLTPADKVYTCAYF